MQFWTHWLVVASIFGVIIGCLATRRAFSAKLVRLFTSQDFYTDNAVHRICQALPHEAE